MRKLHQGIQDELGLSIYVSDDGRVWHDHDELPQTRNNGYQVVHLPGYYSKIRAVHILLLEAWVGPRPDGQVASHTDDDRTNNTLSNLSWTSQRTNVLLGRRNNCYPQRPMDRPLDRLILQVWDTKAAFCRAARMHPQHLGYIQRGTTRPRVSTLERMAAALGITAQEVAAAL